MLEKLKNLFKKNLFKKSDAILVESPLFNKVAGTLAPYIIEREAKREKRLLQISEERRSLIPKDGYTWNPLSRIERNAPCPCGSGLKFKRCHIDKLPRVVSDKQADTYKKAMRAPGGVRFITNENKAKMADEGYLPNDGAGKDEAS